MLIIRVELWPHGSAIGKKEIARMRIYNDGTGQHLVGNYVGETWSGESTEMLDESQANSKVSRRNIVMDWPRALHVWNLVQQMLANMDYGFNGPRIWQ